MQYITTESKVEQYDTTFVLHNDYSPKNNLLIPEHLPVFTAEDFVKFQSKNFSDVVADVLNLFTESNLSGWDVDFCIGRNVFRIAAMNHRIIVAELWHNLDGRYGYVVDRLYSKITEGKCEPTDWFKIAVKIAVLFGVYCEFLKADQVSLNQKFDVSLPVEDFSGPMAVFYARKMGLPIQTIVCACDNCSAVWDLIHRGSFNTNEATPQLQKGIERLIQATLGYDEVAAFKRCCTAGHMYTVSEELLVCVNEAFFCAVTGADRAPAVINSVYQTNAYYIDPTTALSYGALQDYRARTGESRTTLILALTDPRICADSIKKATGVSAKF